MTRNEAKEYIDNTFTFLAISDAYSTIDQIYDDFDSLLSKLGMDRVLLEQRIVELENKTTPFLTIIENQALRERIKELESPKTCNGCKYDSYDWLTECNNCIRKAYGDCYEPKDNL